MTAPAATPAAASVPTPKQHAVFHPDTTLAGADPFTRLTIEETYADGTVDVVSDGGRHWHAVPLAELHLIA